MAKFLSQAWFDEVQTLNAKAGELNLPPSLADLVVNVSITGDDPKELHLNAGKLGQYHVNNAISTINIDSDTLAQIISGKDVNVALEAFMMGKIRIDGDMSAVMALQSAKPSPEQKALYKEILGVTEF
ncbi:MULTISPECIES: SCP2 sterol-binding domain-containing protein [Moraxella]|uniref:SCP2 sterol-binding domain-containing protein n=1 Tax=Moraxella TaxID=475 RepID=UPI00187E8E57|nr:MULTISPECIES: SCP2 sterol-binding domain-containing protein [Moraxella]MBE9578609.1 SCP2 sterol-binding domain-containing protein [Moraxella sp. K1664]MBE9587932.1 SCP2 sterol-binding domain-containing protein [Moraxella sp. K1630]MBE9596161.1 SCP2 sterol-binding domain-containing protein [Moraxella sp. K2450]MDH9218506.1 SCP2 sterol-binding domain-containing protein [Moraxella lacunata]